MNAFKRWTLLLTAAVFVTIAYAGRRAGGNTPVFPADFRDAVADTAGEISADELKPIFERAPLIDDMEEDSDGGLAASRECASQKTDYEGYALKNDLHSYAMSKEDNDRMAMEADDDNESQKQACFKDIIATRYGDIFGRGTGGKDARHMLTAIKEEILAQKRLKIKYDSFHDEANSAIDSQDCFGATKEKKQKKRDMVTANMNGNFERCANEREDGRVPSVCLEELFSKLRGDTVTGFNQTRSQFTAKKAQQDEKKLTATEKKLKQEVEAAWGGGGGGDESVFPKNASGMAGKKGNSGQTRPGSGNRDEKNTQTASELEEINSDNPYVQKYKSLKAKKPPEVGSKEWESGDEWERVNADNLYMYNGCPQNKACAKEQVLISGLKNDSRYSALSTSKRELCFRVMEGYLEMKYKYGHKSSGLDHVIELNGCPPRPDPAKGR